MQITYYRHKKGVLRMHSRDMEYIVGLLKNGKDAEGILSVRRKLNMAFLARTTDLSGKLPVLAFGSTFKKSGDGIRLRRYNGYVLLEVNGLGSQSEAEAVRREAAALPQTLLAFVGLSGRSVKIVVPFGAARRARCRKKRSRPVCFMLRLISWRCGITSRSWAALYR